MLSTTYTRPKTCAADRAESTLDALSSQSDPIRRWARLCNGFNWKTARMPTEPSKLPMPVTAKPSTPTTT